MAMKWDLERIESLTARKKEAENWLKKFRKLATSKNEDVRNNALARIDWYQRELRTVVKFLSYLE
jgi:D-mannonate dehydratase